MKLGYSGTNDFHMESSLPPPPSSPLPRRWLLPCLCTTPLL